MDWDAALDLADGIVAAVMDTQAVTILPRSAGYAVNAAPGADPDRVEFSALASIERDPMGAASAQRPAGDPGSMRSQVFYEAVMTASVVDWPYQPVVGDLLFEGADRDDLSKRWRVAAVMDQGTARPAFMLNRAG